MAGVNKKGLGMLKKVLLAFLVMVVLLVGMVILTGKEKAKLVKAVDPFFETLVKGDVPAAYEMTSPMFKQSITPAQFSDLVQTYGLDTYQGARWTLGQTSAADQKALEGQITTADGRTIHLTITLGSLTGELRIVNIMDVREVD